MAVVNMKCWDFLSPYQEYRMRYWNPYTKYQYTKWGSLFIEDRREKKYLRERCRNLQKPTTLGSCRFLLLFLLLLLLPFLLSLLSIEGLRKGGVRDGNVILCDCPFENDSSYANFSPAGVLLPTPCY